MEILSNTGRNEADRDGIVELFLESVYSAASMTEGKLRYTCTPGNHRDWISFGNTSVYERRQMCFTVFFHFSKCVCDQAKSLEKI